MAFITLFIFPIFLFLFPTFLLFLSPLFLLSPFFSQHLRIVYLFSFDIMIIAAQNHARHIVRMVDSLFVEVGRQTGASPKSPVVAYPHSQREMCSGQEIFLLQRPYQLLVFRCQNGIQLPHAIGQIHRNIDRYQRICLLVSILCKSKHRNCHHEKQYPPKIRRCEKKEKW